jgi:hypothetical protein
MYLVLIVLLVLFLLGGLPQVSGNWHNFGYGPSGIVLVLLVVLVVLALSGRL